MILEHSCREPEVIVKYCVRNFSNVLYREVISRCGHALVNSVYVYVYVTLVCVILRETLRRLRLLGVSPTGHEHTS